MFQVPQPTRYDLNFNFFGVPVRIHPLFWLMGVLFGYGLGELTLIFVWIFALFISILLHEFGHSMAFRVFGWDSYIVLYIFGGLAVPTSARQRGASLTWFEQLVVSLAGPFTGFLFAGVIVGIAVAAGGFIFPSSLFGFIPFPGVFMPGVNPLINSAIGIFLWLNIFWGLINLLPVFPLDGGQAARAIFVRLDPWNGVRKALWLSLFVGGTVAITSLVWMNDIFIAMLFGILALQSFQILQMSR